MKKIIYLFIMIFTVFMFSSCVSSKSSNYAIIPQEYENIFISLDSNKTTLTSGGYLSYANNSMTYIPSSSSEAVLDTIKNRITIQTELNYKGYKVVNNIDDADILMLGGYTTNEFYTDVILAFYNKSTNELLFTSEGRYGLGFGIQSDLNHALKKALEQIPQRWIKHINFWTLVIFQLLLYDPFYVCQKTVRKIQFVKLSSDFVGG